MALEPQIFKTLLTETFTGLQTEEEKGFPAKA
jgi:hypothetical protein